MNPELNPYQYEQLTGGGECDQHYHPIIGSRADVERLQELVRIREVAADYTIVAGDDIIVGNTNVGSITVTLPTSRGQREITVVKSAALNTLTVEFTDGQNCFGQTSFAMVDLGERLRFKAFLGNWILI